MPELVRLILALCSAAAAPDRVVAEPDTRPAADRPQGRLERCTYVSPVDGATIDYALWYPPDYDDTKRWPLIVCLHGSAEGGSWAAPTQSHVGVPVRGVRSDLPALVVYPRMRGSWAISTLAETDVHDTIADVQARAAVDPDRIHLTGLSLGGFATWRIACRYPDRFASIAVFCGGGEPELAGNLRHVAVRVFHGSADKNVSVKESRRMVRALQDAGLSPLYDEIRDAPHTCWVEPYASPELYTWMASHQRAAAPRRISYRTHSLRHHRAYWASIESVIDPARPATIDVLAPSDRQILVHCENVARLVLNPPDSIVRADARPTFYVDGKPIAAQRSPDGWSLTIAAGEQGALEKRPGLSGPITDALYDPFVVVVPGASEPAAADLWRKVAEGALAWTSQLACQNITILPDDEVTPEIIARCHLICFGNPDTHAILKQAADALPLTFRGDRLRVEGKEASSDIAAMLMIHPNPLNHDRYLVVCSGVPIAVAQLAATVLRPPLLARPPAEDLVVVSYDGQLLLEPETPSLDADNVGREGKDRSRSLDGPPAYRSMADPPDPRGVVFDRHWRLSPSARTALRTGSPDG